MATTLIGESRVIRRLRCEIEAIAPTQSTVLLTGETGTGKGLAARVIHERSTRAQGPFVHVDCASLAETVIESELFGHERGAYTGAHDRRQGRFELAEQGTIFLDEIAELEPRLQAKLLRVLQDREYERIGGTRTLTMNARVIAATNQDLRRAVRAKRFRADLYFRLKVVSLVLPPLRDRREDIRKLVEHNLVELAASNGVPVPTVTEEFLERLVRHDWPGNVRELLNVLEHSMIFAQGNTLGIDQLQGFSNPLEDGLEGLPVADMPLPPATNGNGNGDADLDDETADQRDRLAAVLVSTGGNVARAARRLGVPRSTLRHQIRCHGLKSVIPQD